VVHEYPESWWSLIQKRAFVLVTVYSDADRGSLFDIRSIPQVTKVDVVLGAFDAVVTVEGQDEKEIQKAIEGISKTPGVKEAKPLMEVHPSFRPKARPVIGR
jgi:DNA-binding Lrp family transcriptional regulator